MTAPVTTPEILKSINDIQAIGIDIIAMIEKKQYFKAIDMVKALMDLFKDLKGAFPELKTINSEDAKIILQAIMTAVQVIVAAAV